MILRRKVIEAQDAGRKKTGRSVNSSTLVNTINLWLNKRKRIVLSRAFVGYQKRI